MTSRNLKEFNIEFTDLLREKPGWPALLKKGSAMLRQLLNGDWFEPILSKLVLDEEFLKTQWHSIDSYDIQIYRSPEKLYSVRAYIWHPEIMYPIHDHGAWGLVGAYRNQIKERKYERADDGSDPHHVQVRLTSEAILSPGQTTDVLPMSEGIHQMQALNNQTAITIHVYGSPVRKGFINYYNPHNNTMTRMYAPSIEKKVFAIRALGSIHQPWAKDVLKSALNSSNPEFIKDEIRFSLNKIKA